MGAKECPLCGQERKLNYHLHNINFLKKGGPEFTKQAVCRDCWRDFPIDNSTHLIYRQL